MNTMMLAKRKIHAFVIVTLKYQVKKIQNTYTILSYYYRWLSVCQQLYFFANYVNVVQNNICYRCNILLKPVFSVKVNYISCIFCLYNLA